MNWRKIITIFFCLIFTSTSVFAHDIKVYFSPEKQNESVIVALVGSAKKTLDIAAYSLTLPSFAEAIIAAQRRGVQVRVMMDKQQAGGPSSLDEKLIAAKVPVHIDPWGGLQHSKYLIIDKCTVETGSFNFTRNAVKNNQENFLVINDCSLGARFQKNFDKMWADS